MKRIRLVTAAALSFIALAMVYSQSSLQTRQTATAGTQLTAERVVTTQQRINRYFHSDVIPKLSPCWSSLRGNGTIGMKYTFTKSAGRWIFKEVETEQSTLPSGQDAIALKCMRVAVGSTSFPVDREESTQTNFVVRWNWPVPLPTNSSQLATRMFSARANNGGGGGGCDGRGTAAKCFACKASNQDLKCEEVCVGYSSCSITVQSGGGKTCSRETACASGGPFGVSGTVVIF
jgi:hypothetical protein